MSFPEYSFSDEIAAPRDLGIRREGSFNAIADSLTGVNYYMDTIGFGAPTGIAKLRGGVFANSQRPLGLRFFTNTGLVCSNGAPMNDYISTIPRGNSLGKPIENAMNAMNMPSMKGLVPGILEDVQDSLNPKHYISAMQNSSYPACKKVRLPVGDSRNQIRSRYEPEKVWIKDPVQWENGVPTQQRWILDRWITKEEWDSMPKTEGPSPQSKTFTGSVASKGTSECFANQMFDTSQITATLLLGVLLVGIGTYFHAHK